MLVFEWRHLMTRVLTLLSALVLWGKRGRPPSRPGNRSTAFTAIQMEGNVSHIHQHLAIFNHGKPVAGAGRRRSAALRPMLLLAAHAHARTGSSTSSRRRSARTRSGQFFAIWGQPLSRANVAGAKPRPGEHDTVWVDGHAYAGDPRTIELTSHLDVMIDVGPPAPKPKPLRDWNGL